MAMSPQQREQFLLEPRIGIVSIAEAGRGPLAVPVWYDYEPGGVIWFVTDSESRKGKLLKNAGRISLVVQTETPPYQYVSVEGPVAIEPSDVERDLRPMARRYLGERGGDQYIESTGGAGARSGSIKVSITPERWLSVDYGA